MRVLLIRPRAESRRLARFLSQRGIAAIVAPVLEIVAIPNRQTEDVPHQAILLTSGNAARAVPEWNPDRGIPIYCVGCATAGRMRHLGYRNVHAAGGNARDLARLVAGCRQPDAGQLLHLSGDHVTGELAESLAGQGFVVVRRLVYRAEAVTHLDGTARQHIAERRVDGVLLFSPRSAQLFLDLLQRASLADRAAAMTAYCLSDAVARTAARFAWRRVAIAPQSTGCGLLSLLPGS